ncbi:MAG TPA: histidine kinase dimerization/phospho-acceptor domain-containing protein [Opitutus sp.]|nr:histidine kinase dimerization/phospho-acceptor domain-containing protein [Opitutus sp.]
MKPSPPEVASSPAQLRERWLARLNHELKAPLAAMLTEIQATLQRQRTAHAYEKALARCERHVRTLSRLVDQMLDPPPESRRAGKRRRRKTDLAQLLAGCVNDSAFAAAQAGVALRVGACPDRSVYLEPGFVALLVDYLLAVSICHAGAGGIVTVSAASPAAPPATIAIGLHRVELTADVLERATPSLRLAPPASPPARSLLADYAAALGCSVTIEAAGDGDASYVIALAEKKTCPATVP